MKAIGHHAAVFLPPENELVREGRPERRLSTPGTVVVRARASVLPVLDNEGSQRQLSLKTSLTVSEISARIIFSNGWKRGPDTATKALAASTSIVPLGGVIAAQQMISPGPLQHDPLMWVQLVDGHARALASPICIGRASECPSHAEFICPVPVRATAWLVVRECTKSRGPVLDCAGDITIVNGISARLLLARGCDQFGVHDETLGAVDSLVIPKGATLNSPSKVVMAGVGDRTCVSLLFMNGTGQPMANEIAVGTCKQA